MPKNTNIVLLNTPIEEEFIEALAVFFHVAPYPDFNLFHWWNFQKPFGLYGNRWGEVCKLSRALWEKRRALRHSLETRSLQPCP